MGRDSRDIQKSEGVLIATDDLIEFSHIEVFLEPYYLLKVVLEVDIVINLIIL